MAREHIKAFSALPGVKVNGIFSRTRTRAEVLAKEFSVDWVSDSIPELYEKTNADLLIVAVPELMVNTIAKASFKFPWAILMEKPPGYDLADAEDIFVSASGREAPVMVGLNRRFYSSTLAVQEDLGQRSSEKRFIHVQDQQSFEEARRYNHPEQVVEKFMYANSIHLIDLIVTFGRGKITKVERVTPWRGPETEVMLAYIEFDSGDCAVYEGIWQGPGPWGCSVGTKTRRWLMQPLEIVSYQNAGERVSKALELSENDKNFKPGFLLQAEAAVLRSQGKRSEITSLRDCLDSMKLINEIFGV